MDTNIFTIVDATAENLNLIELINLGCTRSSHVGLLTNQNTTLAGLIYGLPILYHEFLRNSDDKDYNVCKFQILNKDLQIDEIRISDDAGIWPPLAEWNMAGRSEIIRNDVRFQNLAKICSSPFSFHLAATKKLFSKGNSVTLCSTCLIKSIDEIIGSIESMRKLLQLIGGRLSNNIGRLKTFYRLIDEEGISWYQESIRNIQNHNKEIKFENGYSISIDDAIDSVLTTFAEMYNLEQNPSYPLIKRPRIVMDTAFYILMDFILSGKIIHDANHHGRKIFVSYHLAGNDLMNYLVYDKIQSSMYRKQVAKLINIISTVFFTNTPWVLKLVKPVVTIGHSQYSYVTNSSFITGDEIFPGSILNLK